MRLYLMVVLTVLGFAERPPIVDAHLHAQPARGAGPMCPQMDSLPPILRLKDGVSGCTKPLAAASSDLQLMEDTLRILREWNIVGVANGAAADVDRWKAAGGHRIIPALGFALPNVPTVDILRQWFSSGRFAVLGEVENQYNGIGPDDPRFEPYLSLAEELDIPVAYHMASGPPGAPYTGTRRYRARLGDPFLLEEALVRHPRLRMYVMHAAVPLTEAMIAMMTAHPQLYVDTGAISWALPRREFYVHLRRLVDAGFGKRILFGSDQLQWPGSIPVAIRSIESAQFLTYQQKRDILFNNACRFFRLEATVPSRHHIK